MTLNTNEAVLLLGTNQGNRMALIKKCKYQIEKLCGQIQKKSFIYESEAWGFESNQNFLNQVIVIKSICSPEELLIRTQKIEQALGRKEKTTDEYEDRPIDIDILFFENQTVEHKDLKIPHPEIQNRRFTLVPLSDVLPDLIHPTLELSISELLKQCSDNINPILFSENGINKRL